jgi:hypothetical protein
MATFLDTTPQCSDSMSSLAAQARSAIMQANKTPSQGSGNRPHRCRVSRCGCVASEDVENRCLCPPNTNTRQPQLKDRQPPKEAFHRYGKGKDLRSPTRAIPISQKQDCLPRDASDATLRLPRDASDATLRQSRSPFGVMPLLDLGDTSPAHEDVACDVCTEAESPTDLPASVSAQVTPTNANTNACFPHSPTNAELTESVLQKSQYLLRQLSGLNLEAAPERFRSDLKDGDNESTYSQEISCRSKTMIGAESLDNKVETVEVPVVLLKVLTDTWEELRASKTPIGASPSVSLLDALDKQEVSKQRTGNVSSRCSTASTGPTAVSESESDSACQSPQTATFDSARSSRVNLHCSPLQRMSSQAPVPPSVPATTPRAATASVPLSLASTALSPRRGALLKHAGSTTSLGTASACLGTVRLQSPRAVSPRCRRLSAPPPVSSRMVSVQTHSPRGAPRHSVSVSVTTSQTLVQTQTYHFQC